jgi:hypothetical protein
MNDKLVTVARFSDYMRAELARQLLESEGITAFVMGQNVAAGCGGVPAAIDVQLQTPESQADEAKEILEASRPQEGEELDQDSEEGVEQDWDEDTEQEQDEDLEQE